MKKEENPYFVKVPGLPAAEDEERAAEDEERAAEDEERAAEDEERAAELAELWCVRPCYCFFKDLCPYCRVKMEKKILIRGGDSRGRGVSCISCPKCGAREIKKTFLPW